MEIYKLFPSVENPPYPLKCHNPDNQTQKTRK